MKHFILLLAALALLTACGTSRRVSAAGGTEPWVGRETGDILERMGTPDRIDPDGNVYMQVINPGDRKNDRAKKSQTIYFRFTRFNLEEWYSTGVMGASSGNETDMSQTPTSFLYKDFTLATSSQWGYGLQLPLDFLGAECEVNLVIKSQYGWTSEISYVQPYLYHVRYFHSQI